MNNDLFKQDQADETEDYGPDILTVEDEDGVEHVFEVVDDTEINDKRYVAVVPYSESDEDFEDEAELLIMRISEVDGEEVLDIVDDESELAEVGKVFAQRLSELFDIDLGDIEGMDLEDLN